MDFPLGINPKTKRPYKAMVIVDSISEKKLLEQNIRAADFQVEEPSTEIISFFKPDESTENIEPNNPKPTTEKIDNDSDEIDIDDKEIDRRNAEIRLRNEKIRSRNKRIEDSREDHYKRISGGKSLYK